MAVSKTTLTTPKTLAYDKHELLEATAPKWKHTWDNSDPHEVNPSLTYHASQFANGWASRPNVTSSSWEGRRERKPTASTIAKDQGRGRLGWAALGCVAY